MESAVTLSTEHWLKAFAAAVRNRDFEAGKAMFENDVIGFGTVAFRAQGLDELLRMQWAAIWPNTEGFDFDYHVAVEFVDEKLAVVAVPWTSSGIDEQGKAFPRRGRSTIALQRFGDEWKAVHTHFSIDPA